MLAPVLPDEVGRDGWHQSDEGLPLRHVSERIDVGVQAKFGALIENPIYSFIVNTEPIIGFGMYLAFPLTDRLAVRPTK
jgi:hypothetical protein